MANITVHFKHKVQSINFEQKIISIRNLDAATDVNARFDLCIGADGSYSVVRRQLMRVVL
jgi:kynurenine 3-monooxygenase